MTTIVVMVLLAITIHIIVLLDCGIEVWCQPFQHLVHIEHLLFMLLEVVIRMV